MSAQFLHIAIYGRRRRKGGARHETALGMLNEAARIPSASQHISNPIPPRLLYGREPKDIARSVLELSATSRDSRGRKLRSDAGLLMCIVASYPVPLAKMSGVEEFENWQKFAIDWLQRTFGDHFAGAVLHQDEPYGHVHGFVLPSQMEDRQLAWEKIHPGRRAKRKALAAGASSRDQDRAYISAMRQLQDDFYAAVSSQFGHDRLTVRRKRLTRESHLEIRALAAKNSELATKVARLESELSRLAVTNQVHSTPLTQNDADVGGDDMGDYLEYEFEETQTFGFEDEEDDIGPDGPLHDIGDASELEWEEQADWGNELEPDESDREISDS